MEGPVVFFIVALVQSVFTAQSDPTPSVSRPNIIFILIDDLGWNDVGFHGSNQIPTPNLDALAYSGVVLNNYYVTPICTPSRSALMTGKHPIHTGMQHSVLYGGERRGLPLGEKLLPEYLKEAGYTNHLVGKWHLGFYKEEYTPTRRGFHSHLGYWTGHQDYNDHTAMETGLWGLDMRRNLDPAWDLHGKYSTDVFTDEAVRLIKGHNPLKGPMFLYLAHAAVHSGNPYNPLPAPDAEAAKFINVTSDYKRQRFAGMLTKLDRSVGSVVQALQARGMLQNSIVVISTDNGGPAAGFNLNAASNWPLRGVKDTLWEGGVRGVGAIWSPLIKRPARVSNQMMHISDWLPTLLSAAKIHPVDLKGLDGIDMWPALMNNLQSNRTQVLHNIDDIYGSSSLTVNNWKLLKGTNYRGKWDEWYGPSGRSQSYIYDPKLVIKSPTAQAFTKLGKHITLEQIHGMRKEAEVNCNKNKNNVGVPCKPLLAPCLFDIKKDPCEINNLANVFPDVLHELTEILNGINKTAVAPGNLPIDPEANPNHWGHVWTNFGDFDRSEMAHDYL